MCSNKSTLLTCVVEYYLGSAAVNLVLRYIEEVTNLGMPGEGAADAHKQNAQIRGNDH